MMKSSAQYSHDQIKSGNRGKGGKPSEPIIDTNKVLLNLKYKRNVYEYKESGKGRESMSRRRWKLHKEKKKKKGKHTF
jgi:hypothetical protein